MLSFLFWNIQRQPIAERVARIAMKTNVNVLMLAECEISTNDLVQTVSNKCGRMFSIPFTLGEKIRILTDLPVGSIIDEFNSPLSHLTIRRIRIIGRCDILLAVIHMQSQVNWNENDLALEATVLARDIINVEDRVAHQRTVLVGDMNMNPFDLGVIAAQGLNGVMTKQLAKVVERTVAGRKYRCFYNPTWGLFGDRTVGPAGTYFLASSKPTNRFWNIYDQVLLRPALMDALYHLEIPVTDGIESLVTKGGRPRKTSASDHLPLHFVLDL